MKSGGNSEAKSRQFIMIIKINKTDILHNNIWKLMLNISTNKNKYLKNIWPWN